MLAAVADDVPFALPARIETASRYEIATTEIHPDAIAELEQLERKTECEVDHLYFTRYFFKQRTSLKFRVNWHHLVIAAALEKVIAGETKNLLLNVPPGSSKTEMAVINFIARGLAINPQARFLHISSGDELVMLNSQTARDIVESHEYREFWPLDIADDAKAKKRWNVMVDHPTKAGKKRKGGGVYAVALGGQITGFRAGHMTDGFTGAIIIDDPIKSDDSYSEAKVNAANRRLVSTVESRRANPDVPVIIIMQRVGEKDPSGFVKGGNLPGVWECIAIPALIDDAYIDALPPYIREIARAQTKDSPRDQHGRFSYWEYKEPLEKLLAMEEGRGTDEAGNRISRFTFASQYQQAPKALGGNLIHGQRFVRVAMVPKLLYRKIYADTAMKTAERNDFSVFQCWGFGEDLKAYRLDQIRGKWEAPELEKRALDFWRKHSDKTLYPSTQWGTCRQMKVEDKASGTGLIQGLKTTHRVPVRGVERNKDKLTRVMDVLPFIEAGFVCLIDGQADLNDFIAECEAFTADDSHAHDDQIDPMCDAIADLLGPKPRGFFSVTPQAQRG